MVPPPVLVMVLLAGRGTVPDMAGERRPVREEDQSWRGGLAVRGSRAIQKWREEQRKRKGRIRLMPVV
jgi:hypothetical protein